MHVSLRLQDIQDWVLPTIIPSRAVGNQEFGAEPQRNENDRKGY